MIWPENFIKHIQRWLFNSWMSLVLNVNEKCVVMYVCLYVDADEHEKHYNTND